MAIAPILSWEGLGLLQGNGWLFQDIALSIAPRDRLALIGRNGRAGACDPGDCERRRAA